MNTLFQDNPTLVLGEFGELGADCFHLFAVAQFPRVKEDGPVEAVLTIYNSDAGAAKHWRPENPSPRRDGLCILLGSESGEWLEIQIAQHKGPTYIGQTKPVFCIVPYASRGAK